MKACVIGAGASGITVGKSLEQHGIAFDCIEKGSDLGGLWRYDNDSGSSAAYRSLQIDTSSRSLSYADFPVPEGWPEYLRHSQVLEYLRAYAEHYRVIEHIETSTEVLAVRQNADGEWDVEMSTGEIRTYSAVIVANGHLSQPKMAGFAGRFRGPELHSHEYRTPEPFTGQRVIVVGMGNSGCDIAVDLARSAEQVYLAARRGAWVLPKYLLGRPTDQWSAFFTRRLRFPTKAARTLVKTIADIAVGNQERYGVPKPGHKIHQEHATISQELLPYTAYGWIQIKPNIERKVPEGVVFTDGSMVRADAIIYATGYEITFPFLSKDMVEDMEWGSRLYRRIVHPDLPGLFFAGLVQPVGPTIPLAEIQGRWIAKALTGAIPLPDSTIMDAETQEHKRWVRDNFVDSQRYRLEVDFRGYAGTLKSDMARSPVGSGGR